MPHSESRGKNEESPPEAQGSPETGSQEAWGGAADRRAPYKPEYVPLWENVITIAGLFVTVIAVLMLVTFALFTVVTPTPNPYIDIAGYLVLPSILIVGVVLMPVGIFFKSWRLRRRNPEQALAFRFPHVDLNDPAQRRVAKFVAVGSFVLLPVVGVSSYHGYHYTDSAEFCSKACHTAMAPQATTYEYSAHARVPCAECHIGAGASWFVRAKLSGTRQVLAMLQNSFSRPIAPAISHLRPARETCEHCHWPKKFFGAQLREIVYYSSDEENTRHEIDMLLKTGGGDPSTGRMEGIHLHMALEGGIEYIATDNELQVIPWVKYTDEAGRELIYRSDGRPSSDPPPAGELRALDCMDCHNRPAHKFRSPNDAVDVFLDSDLINDSLPYIKREAVAVLSVAYPNTDEALKRIGTGLADFYEQQYPEVWRDRRSDVNRAIDGVREIYRQTVFPDMKVDWRTYPDNIGHKISPGCFRCHEGRHINQRGELISHACDICHTFLNPVEQENGRNVVERGDFVHAIPLLGRHKELRCNRCHTGGPSPLPTCAGCHSTQAEFREGTLAAFEGFEISADSMADSVECQDCHDLSGPIDIQTIDRACVDCHDDEEYSGMVQSWKQEIAGLLEEAEAGADGAAKSVIEALRQAGPLHNIEAARRILATGGDGPSEPVQ